MIAYDRLSQIIPADQALANKALSVALSQISNIINISAPGLASAYKNIATVNNLNQINSLTQPLPNSVSSYFTSNYGIGTGPGNTLVITDVIGTSAGVGFTDNFESVNTVINELETAGTLSTLIEIYTRMNKTVDSVYGPADGGPVVIPAGPGAGTYGGADDALASGLIPAANVEIGNIISANSVATTDLNTYFDAMSAKIVSENNNINLAGINPATIQPASKQLSASFAQTLSSYAINIQVNGPAQYLEQVANVNDLGGQALVATLRQSRNDVVLGVVNVTKNNTVNTVVTPGLEPATLSPSTYTAQQAANLIVK